MPDVYEMHYVGPGLVYNMEDYSRCYLLMDSAYIPKAFILYNPPLEQVAQLPADDDNVGDHIKKMEKHPLTQKKTCKLFLSAIFDGINKKDVFGNDFFPNDDYVITAVSDAYPGYDADFVEHKYHLQDLEPDEIPYLHGPIANGTKFSLCFTPTVQDMFIWQPQIPEPLKKQLARDLEIIQGFETDLKSLHFNLSDKNDRLNQQKKLSEKLQNLITNYKAKKAKYELFVDGKDFSQILDYLPQNNVSITVKALKANIECKIPILIVK